MNPTQTVKSVEKTRIRERIYAVDAVSLVRSGGTSVKSKKGTTRSFLKVSDFEKNARERNRRTGADQKKRN